MPSKSPSNPTPEQIEVTRAVTAWYLDVYYQTDDDIGLIKMFCDPSLVGHFAVSAEALSRGAPKALFKLFVTMIMFQRRSDQQIMRVLRGISKEDADELTSADKLLQLVDDSGCPHVVNLTTLKTTCDLTKDANARGVCGERPNLSCHMKRHAELLKRYGHFGKVPTAAALIPRAEGVEDLATLKERVWSVVSDPYERAREIEAVLCKAWRVSDKISSMYLSSLTNKDLSSDLAPWSEGVDTSHFVVIDSNVDLFLTSIGYEGVKTYNARRTFIQHLAKRVRLDELNSDLSPYNPRLIQQAMYMFMSESNRRSSELDCSHLAPLSCQRCPLSLFSRCARRPKGA